MKREAGYCENASNSGAYNVQTDFTGREGFKIKLYPAGGLLRSFIDLNNKVLPAGLLRRRKAVPNRRYSRPMEIKVIQLIKWISVMLDLLPLLT